MPEVSFESSASAYYLRGFRRKSSLPSSRVRDRLAARNFSRFWAPSTSDEEHEQTQSIFARNLLSAGVHSFVRGGMQNRVQEFVGLRHG